MLPCALYRRQVDVCYTCGELGHRADVCPNGEEKGNAVVAAWFPPPEDHQCDPKCAICGGAHPTADRRCSRRFQVPYIVRQRRRRRQSRSRTRSRSRDHSHSRSRERSHSSVRIQKRPTWADKVKGKTNGQKVTEATLPEQKEDPRIVALKQENAQLKEEMRKLRADLELIRKAQNGQGSTSPAPTLKPVLGQAKRKAPPPSRPRSRWSRWRRRPGPRPP
ncbi:hypothetical protein MTO96_037047 [Rhipicephalus appendiculatus]